MKTTLAVILSLTLPLATLAQSNSIKGTPVVDVDLGYSTSQGLINPFATAVNPTLSGVTGTNVNIDFSQPVTVWSTTNAPAVRFAFINKPTTATNGPTTSIQIIGQVNTVLTNVADTINWIGPWGTLNANTNYIDVWWDGTVLNAAQSPNHGIAVPAQITSNQNDYNPTGLNIIDELRVTTDAARTLTGMQGRTGGKILLLENVGSFPLTLSETNVASATTNQFRNGYDVVLGNHQTALLLYSITSQRWKVVGSWQLHPAMQNLVDGATITITVDPIKVSENQVVTLGGNRTLAITGATSGTTGVLFVNQDNVGSRTLTLPANSKVINGGGGVIPLTTTPLATDILTWFYNGTNYYWNQGLFYN